MSLLLSGVLLDTERKADSFTNDAGEKIPYDFTVLHILDGRVVRKARLPKDIHNHPFKTGEQITVEVELFGQPKTVITPDSLAAAASKS